jgi:trigger factor
MTNSKSYVSAEIKKLPKSGIEISGIISPETWESFRKQALKDINDSITIDGFRKGMVPENVLIAKIGEQALHEEMAELALSKAYVEIIIDNKIDAIGRPQVQITKLAKGNPLEFKAMTAVVPEVTLPDYKALSQKEIKKMDPKELKVVDKDIEDAILRIRKSHASHENHDHKKMTAEEHDKAIEASMPAFTDEFVKTLGDFKDVPDFKIKLSEMITEQKKDEAKEKLRIKIADALAENSKMEIPEIMIQTEIKRIQSQFEADIERMGVKLEDYLKHAKKTIEEIRKEWLPHAEKKAKLQLVLNAIADAEKIKPDQNEIETEVGHIIEHYKDADRESAAVYAETVLTNEKVFSFLENIAK